MEQTLEPDSTLLSVFPHEVCSERYCTHIVGILHSGSLCSLRCNYCKNFSCVVLVCCLWTRYSTAVFLGSLWQFYHFLKGIISHTFWTLTRCIVQLVASENLFQYLCLIYCTCFPQADFIWGITRYLWKIGRTRISPSRVESLCQNGT